MVCKKNRETERDRQTHRQERKTYNQKERAKEKRRDMAIAQGI